MKFNFLLIVVVLIAGCAKTHTIQPATIIGKWSFESIAVDTFLNNQLQSTVKTENFSEAEYLTFNNDGTGEAFLNNAEATYFERNFEFEYSQPQLKLRQYQNGGQTSVLTTYTIDELEITRLVLHTEATYTYNNRVFKRVETYTLSKPR